MSFSVECTGQLTYREPVDETEAQDESHSTNEELGEVDASLVIQREDRLIAEPSFKGDDATYEAVFRADSDAGVFTWHVTYTSSPSGQSIESVSLTEPEGVEVEEDVDFYIHHHDPEDDLE